MACVKKHKIHKAWEDGDCQRLLHLPGTLDVGSKGALIMLMSLVAQSQTLTLAMPLKAPPGKGLAERVSINRVVWCQAIE